MVKKEVKKEKVGIHFECSEDVRDILKEYCQQNGVKIGFQIEKVLKNWIESLKQEGKK